ncbi:MAG: hypothetical protein ACN4GR_00335 [Arenicellales bacterium]
MENELGKTIAIGNRRARKLVFEKAGNYLRVGTDLTGCPDLEDGTQLSPMYLLHAPEVPCCHFSVVATDKTFRATSVGECYLLIKLETYQLTAGFTA